MAEKTNRNNTDAAGMQGSLFGDADAPSLSAQEPAEKPAGPARTARARAAELNRILNHAAYAYYALDAPEMTDAQFDRFHWGSRNAMDIDGLGDELVGRLVENGTLTDVADYYDKLTVDALASTPTGRSYETSTKDHTEGEDILVGRTIAEKVMTQVDESRGRGLARVLFGLGIRHVGANVATVLARHFGSLQALMAAGEEDIATIDGIGPKIAASVCGLWCPRMSACWSACARRALCLRRKTTSRSARRRLPASPLSSRVRLSTSRVMRRARSSRRWVPRSRAPCQSARALWLLVLLLAPSSRRRSRLVCLCWTRRRSSAF